MKNIASNTKKAYRDLWQTQKWFVDQIAEIAKVTFVLDPCANSSSKKGIVHISKSIDGLDTDWVDFIECSDDLLYFVKNPAAFVNPPFSQIEQWIDKIIEETNKGLTIFLVHPDTNDTGWCQKITANCTYQLVPRSRLNYIDPETGKKRSGVNFHSCVSVFSGVKTGMPPRVRFTLENPKEVAKAKSRNRVKK